MPSAENDFQLTVDRAASSLLDAACAVRAALACPLPHPHRRWLQRAIDELDRAQLDLFKARNDPWSQPPLPRQRQLALL